MTQVHERDFLDAPGPVQRVATSRHGMVATAHDGATQAGIEMLEAGGNAFDAAIAAALALGVSEPQASGLGGQSMVLYHDAARHETVALDGSSRAPETASPHTIAPEDRIHGYRATTVPSTPAVMSDLVREHATLTRAELLNPAIRLAEDGYTISAFQERLLRERAEDIREGTAARFFLKEGWQPYSQGERHRQPELAKTLRGLQTRGFDDFYSGRIAHAIARDMESHNGLITRRDLAQVPWPIARRPDLGRWQHQSVATFPPPGAGRVLLELLHVIERAPARFTDPGTPRGAVFLARAMRQALTDHMNEPRDPARHQMTPHRMIAEDHARALAVRLCRDMPHETTHLSVMDRDGNAVGITQSIEHLYGACAVTEELGFLYNNYISAFAPTDDPGHPYALRPNAVPWSSVAPAILFRRGKPRMIIGSPGSDRIPTAIAQVLLHMRTMSAMEAVEAPRLHAVPQGTAMLESPRFPNSVPEALEADGFDIVHHDAFSRFHGCVQLVERHDDGFIGVADPRRDGTAGGPAR